MSSVNTKNRTFFPDIETLRAIAVVMTMMAHFIPADSVFHIPYMYYGVDLFFTISGFLITFILFGTIHKASPLPHKTILKNFFVRRALRLFPSYYLLVISFFLLRNLFSVYIWNNEYNLYFFSYLQNIYFFKQGALNNSFSHLWSLGVEEQFYLVWPFLILWVNKKAYPFIFSFFIIASIVINTIYQGKIDAIRVLTTSNLHTLGIGALLAWIFFFKQDSKWFSHLKKYRHSIWFICLSTLVVVLNVGFSSTPLRTLLVESFLMFTTGSTVLNSIIGWPQFSNFLFKNKYIHQIGKVSYGIYLYHMLVPPVLVLVATKIPVLSIFIPENELLQFFVFSMLSVLIAFISYYSYEVWFLKLKQKFSDQKAKSEHNKKLSLVPNEITS
jgi:peptidoglycan/LPS O-acetylase OafA/YrhL